MRAVAGALAAGHALLHHVRLAKRVALADALAALRVEADGLRAVAGALGAGHALLHRVLLLHRVPSAPATARRPSASARSAASAPAGATRSTRRTLCSSARPAPSVPATACRPRPFELALDCRTHSTACRTRTACGVQGKRARRAHARCPQAVHLRDERALSGRARAQVVEKPPFFMKPTDHREVIHVNFFAAAVRGARPGPAVVASKHAGFNTPRAAIARPCVAGCMLPFLPSARARRAAAPRGARHGQHRAARVGLGLGRAQSALRRARRWTACTSRSTRWSATSATASGRSRRRC